MTDGVVIRSNLPEVMAKLNALRDDLKNRTVRAAANAGAQVLAKRVREAVRAKTTTRSGVLSRSVIVSRNRRKLRGSEVYRVRFRAGRSARVSKGTRLDAFYWYWVDQGHVTRGAKALRGGKRAKVVARGRLKASGNWVRGRFFMQDGFRAGQSEAVDVVYRRIDRALANFR